MALAGMQDRRARGGEGGRGGAGGGRGGWGGGETDVQHFGTIPAKRIVLRMLYNVLPWALFVAVAYSSHESRSVLPNLFHLEYLTPTASRG